MLTYQDADVAISTDFFYNHNVFKIDCPASFFRFLTIIIIIFGTNGIASARQVDPPNIILINVDTLRRDHLGVYGYSAETMPFVEAKAKTGLIFTNYFSNASETIASHASLFSGKLSDSASPKIKHSFVEKLKKSGYRTYGISANPLVSKQFQFDRGFDAFESDPPPEQQRQEFLMARLLQLETKSGQKNSLSVFLSSHLAATADLINPRIYNCLEQHIAGAKKNPFFLFINYLDPHDPYFPKEKSTLSGNYNIRDEENSLRSFFCERKKITNERRKELVHLYDGEIKFVDSAISQLYEWIKSRKMLENTVFIVSSDHGEMLGENNLFTHSIALYPKELEIPMVVFGKNIKPGRVDFLMSHMDTGSFILSLVSGSTKKFLESKQSASVIMHCHYVFKGEKSWRACLPIMGRVGLLGFTGIKTTTFYYQAYGKEKLGVYDKEDRDLKKNKFHALPVPEQKKLLKQLKHAIDKYNGKPKTIDNELERQLRSLGYL